MVQNYELQHENYDAITSACMELGRCLYLYIRVLNVEASVLGRRVELTRRRCTPNIHGTGEPYKLHALTQTMAHQNVNCDTSYCETSPLSVEPTVRPMGKIEGANVDSFFDVTVISSLFVSVDKTAARQPQCTVAQDWYNYAPS